MNRRIKSSAATLTMLLAFSIVCVVFSGRYSTIPASGSTGEAIYAFSYRSIEILNCDLEIFCGGDYEFVLSPKDVNRKSVNISIIIEMDSEQDTIKAAEILAGMRVPAIVVINDSHDSKIPDRLKSVFGSTAHLLGYAFNCDANDSNDAECADNEVDFFRQLNEARLSFFMRFGETCSCFMLTEGSIIIDAVDNEQFPQYPDISIWGFGNGINYFGSDRGLAVNNRIVRLEEWGLAEYFHSIIDTEYSGGEINSMSGRCPACHRSGSRSVFKLLSHKACGCFGNLCLCLTKHRSRFCRDEYYCSDRVAGGEYGNDELCAILHIRIAARYSQHCFIA